MTTRPDGAVVATTTDIWNDPIRNEASGLRLSFTEFRLTTFRDGGPKPPSYCVAAKLSFSKAYLEKHKTRSAALMTTIT